MSSDKKDAKKERIEEIGIAKAGHRRGWDCSTYAVAQRLKRIDRNLMFMKTSLVDYRNIEGTTDE